MTTNTDIEQFITELEAGVFAEKLGHAISQVAAGVCDNEKKGQIKLVIDFKLAGNHQVNLEHELEYKVPRRNGLSTEKTKTNTIMHVGKGGRCTLFPENQAQMFDKKGSVNKNPMEQK